MFYVNKTGDIRSENADMSSINPCVKHGDLKFKGFCARLILAEKAGL